ncbi:tetrahydromethanopterin S-methyltransferase subunit E [Curtobacterium luteum]|uniref:Tetrahydromethanopterin S-methyltransferase subunit E n=1 Tax=Curtobacterium luteum TaxID=33881 RepID=A0A8H9L2A6_9MICO|nr:hypothetical protein [Curtobacterium luteum]MBM7803701.1 tetrahydromethanopterin S-methyltransferase subunit E [Curtobacterium luteum]GGL03157.1 hypothetical protein GCM10009769_21650 [Curtobacterium luteum]
MIVKQGKELLAGIAGSAFVIGAVVLLLSPLREQESRHGFPVWLLALVMGLAGLVLLIGVVLNVARRKRG